jgi:predicted N-acetyltransferase YhbS
MAGRFAVRRCADEARAREIHAFTHAVFGALDIDPPSSVLRETETDFVARLAREACFIAEAEGRLIGSIFCAAKADSLYIGRLAVAPEWRRRGVAGALIEAARDEAKRRGFARMTLGARIALAGNVALFRRHGFVVVAETCHPGFTRPTSCDMELALG